MSLLDSLVPTRRIGYFSIEIALRPEIHIYAGGLGMLAGDFACLRQPRALGRATCARKRRRGLADRQNILVECLPEKPGEHEFACPMGMFRGRLIVE